MRHCIRFIISIQLPYIYEVFGGEKFMGILSVVLLVFFVIIAVLLVLLVLIQNEEGNSLGGIFAGG